MDHLQIELLYCRYGWSISKIASTLVQKETYIQQVINEYEWEQGTQAEENTSLQINGEQTTNGQVLAIQALKDNEVHKQGMLAPLVAITEIQLLGKISDAISRIDTDESDAHIKLTNLVKSFKQLTQDSVTSKVVDDTNGKPGIAIQVITQIT